METSKRSAKDPTVTAPCSTTRAVIASLRLTFLEDIETSPVPMVYVRFKKATKQHFNITFLKSHLNHLKNISNLNIPPRKMVRNHTNYRIFVVFSFPPTFFS
jgi:hypothetical protein